VPTSRQASGDGGTSVGQASRLQMVLAEAPVGDRPARQPPLRRWPHVL